MIKRVAAYAAPKTAIPLELIKMVEVKCEDSESFATLRRTNDLADRLSLVGNIDGVAPDRGDRSLASLG